MEVRFYDLSPIREPEDEVLEQRRLLLGVDAGQTYTKAVVYTLDGRPAAVARRPVSIDRPHLRWAERDMEALWQDTCSAIAAVRRMVAGHGRIVAVGVCGHNDGLYAIDSGHRPVRPAILAMDSRAYRQSARLSRGVPGVEALSLTGQVPSPVSPASMLLWLREHEPTAYRRVRWVLSCKDWLRLRLTGEVATDVTEASAAFLGLRSRQWSERALELFDLADAAALLPVVRGSAEVAGTVTAEAAAASGLPAGIPVVMGAHDVDAAAIGVGATAVRAASLILGTYSINQVVSDQPVSDPRWQARAFVHPDRWLHMSTSPAGAICLDWAVRLLGPCTGSGRPDYPAAIEEAARADADRPPPLFLPFLYGSPHGPHVGGSWLGLSGWHTRADLLASVLEGVAFNHRTHFDALLERFAVGRPVRVCGGGARSPAWTQLLADVLNASVEVTDSDEAGARGAAMLAAVGAGEASSTDDLARHWVRVVRTHEPSPPVVEERSARYDRFLAAGQAVTDADDR